MFFPYSRLHLKVPLLLQSAIRGLVETNFGGYETWKGNKTRMRLEETQKLDIELMSICQLIRTYFKILEIEKFVLKIIYLIFRQPQLIQKGLL